MGEAKKLLTTQYTWQKERLRDGRVSFPGSSLSGQCYGPEGDYSLYLPSPKMTRRVVFIDGKPTIEETGDLLALPEIVELRNKVRSMGAVDIMPSMGTILFSDAVIAEYSAALLRLNYNFSDDDLTFLHSGRKWHEPIIVHAIGGSAERDALREADLRPLAIAALETEQSITRAMIGEPAQETFIDGEPADYAAVEIALALSAASGDDDELDLASD